jgi:circadian clock protein KaiC
MKQVKGDKSKTNSFRFPKSQTGIPGLDEMTNGGIPKNRPTLVLGNTGCGKTIFAMEFLINGIEMFDEPGVFMAFEEQTNELVQNVKSLNYNLSLHLEKIIYTLSIYRLILMKSKKQASMILKDYS